MKRKKIFGFLGTIGFFVIIFAASIIFIRNFNFIINDPTAVRGVIQRYGLTAYFIYFLFYVFQIFFAPVPGQVLNVASGMLFGPLKGFLISWVAVMTGGLLAMLVSRFWGKKILCLFLEERAANFETTITRRGLPLILFLALFPNPVGDGIFYLAGLTNIPIWILSGLIGLCRIPGILIYVFMGDRVISSGLKGWVIGGIGFMIAIVLYFIFRKRLERVFEKYIRKINVHY